MRNKIIKNGAVFIGTGVIVFLFFVFFNKYGNDVYKTIYLLPFMMCELAIAVFSLYWSMTDSNALGLINTALIILTLGFATAFTVVEAIIATAPSMNYHGTVLQRDICMYGTCALIAVCLIYGIYLDFFSKKHKKTAQKTDNK
jgi:ABC-type sugar transport system permease subunit